MSSESSSSAFAPESNGGREPPGRWQRLTRRDHTTGSLATSMWVLSVPLMLSSLLGGAVFQLIDLSFITRLGEDSVTAIVVTNHFQGRPEGRPAGRDSTGRMRDIRQSLEHCLANEDKKVSADEVWQALDQVAKSDRINTTVHSLVFRAQPWLFELRIGEVRPDNKIVPSTRSDRRYQLTREQIFPDDPSGER